MTTSDKLREIAELIDEYFDDDEFGYESISCL